MVLELIENKIDNVLSNISGKGLDYNELALYTSIISMAVNNEHESTIMELGKIFKEYKNDKSVIHPNFRSAKFISLMKRYNKGEEELFDELYDLYCAEKSGDVKNSMLGTLGSSNNLTFKKR